MRRNHSLTRDILLPEVHQITITPLNIEMITTIKRNFREVSIPLTIHIIRHIIQVVLRDTPIHKHTRKRTVIMNSSTSIEDQNIIPNTPGNRNTTPTDPTAAV